MKLVQLSLIIGTLSILVGCSGYHKLLKSDDHEKKYSEALKYFYNKDYTKSMTLLNNVAADMSGSIREDTVMFYMAKSLYNINDFENGSELMNKFRYKFPRSSFIEEAEFIYSMCFYKQSGTYERDQSKSFTAIQAFNEYLNRYPESIKTEDIHQMVDELTRKIYQKRFNNAALYYKLGKYNAAVTALRSTLKQYPEIPFKEDMMYLICKSWFDYAVNSIPSRQLDRYLKMMDSYYDYKAEYPEETKQLKELEALYLKSKKFSDEHGYQAQAIEKNQINISERKATIAEKKNKLFYATTKEERKKLNDEIKYEREAIKKDREVIKENKVEIKLQEKEKKNREKEKTNVAPNSTPKVAVEEAEEKSDQ